MVARTSALHLLVLLAVTTALLSAQAVTYVYDKAGRLIAVVNASGESAVYTYDAVGNLLSITRRPTGTVSVIEFTPDTGSIGTRSPFTEPDSARRPAATPFSSTERPPPSRRRRRPPSSRLSRPARRRG